MDIQELIDDHGKDDAQDDGGAGAEHDPVHALLGRKRAACKRDDDRVIARQNDVDANDPRDRDRCHPVAAEHLENCIEDAIAESGCDGDRLQVHF